MRKEWAPTRPLTRVTVKQIFLLIIVVTLPANSAIFDFADDDIRDDYVIFLYVSVHVLVYPIHES